MSRGRRAYIIVTASAAAVASSSREQLAKMCIRDRGYAPADAPVKEKKVKEGTVTIIR